MEITDDDVTVTQIPMTGWGVATAGGETVALDLSVSPALRAQGWAREVIRLIQDARKSTALNVTDRISVRWSAVDPDLAAALAAQRDMIAAEVLATEFKPATEEETSGTHLPDAASSACSWDEHSDAELGFRFWLALC